MSLEIKLLKTWLEGKIEETEAIVCCVEPRDHAVSYMYYEGRLGALREVWEELK